MWDIVRPYFFVPLIDWPKHVLSPDKMQNFERGPDASEPYVIK